jgi:hypothetical protein
MKRLLIITLIFFLLLFNISIQFSFDIEAPTLYKFDRGCKDIDIRLNSTNFVKLKNCDRVHGYLRISDLNFDENIEPSDVREITGYLLIDSVKNLRILSQIIPYLSVIRGEKLYQNKFSIVIVNNGDLEFLGLNELIHIKNGNVKIINNRNLKYANKINFNYEREDRKHEIFVIIIQI